jgi:HPt (histidine-containing phosphotransfer) domain-containing protein
LLRAIRETMETARRSPFAVRRSTLAKPGLNARIAAHVPAYLQNCQENVAAILTALGRNDLGSVTYLAHNMRGSGGAFGFDAITDIATELEAAAVMADRAGSVAAANALSAFLNLAVAALPDPIAT